MGIAITEEFLETLEVYEPPQQPPPPPVLLLVDGQQQQYVQHHQQVVHVKEEPNQEHCADVANISSFVSPNDYGGDFDFEVFINPHHGKKSPWVFSSALNKIFITINQCFPIEFKCKPPPAGSRFYVRATPVFAEQQHAVELVTRCINHAHADEATNKNCAPAVWEHVVRAHSKHAVYEGSRTERRHLNVRVPYGSAAANSADSAAIVYQFMCKNSCGSEWGMNRRAIAVVFTLEDEHRRAVGQRVLSVRICSCPKRDKEKEEVDFYKKDSSGQQQLHSKKRKLEKKSTEVVNVDKRHFNIEVPILGAANAKELLRWAHARMASEMLLSNSDHHAYTQILKEIEAKMNAPTTPSE